MINKGIMTMALNKEKKEYIFAACYKKQLALLLPRFIFDIDGTLRNFRVTIPELNQVQQIERVLVTYDETGKHCESNAKSKSPR